MPTAVRTRRGALTFAAALQRIKVCHSLRRTMPPDRKPRPWPPRPALLQAAPGNRTLQICAATNTNPTIPNPMSLCRIGTDPSTYSGRSSSLWDFSVGTALPARWSTAGLHDGSTVAAPLRRV